MNRLSLFLGVAVALSAATTAHAQTVPAPAANETTAASALDGVLTGSWRDPANVVRDGYRHPKETLTFFGIAPTQTVIEITPGGGWYSEILAPYLRGSGQYIAAVVDPASVAEGRGRDYQQKNKTTLETKFAAASAQYG
ncbi:MAG: methyltransferase, partial [Pseudoxanthomonas sp.]